MKCSRERWKSSTTSKSFSNSSNTSSLSHTRTILRRSKEGKMLIIKGISIHQLHSIHNILRKVKWALKRKIISVCQTVIQATGVALTRIG
jgi:hypothetical protein